MVELTSSTQTMRALVAATMCPVEFLVTPPSIEEKSREKPNQGLEFQSCLDFKYRWGCSTCAPACSPPQSPPPWSPPWSLPRWTSTSPAGLTGHNQLVSHSLGHIKKIWWKIIITILWHITKWKCKQDYIHSLWHISPSKLWQGCSRCRQAAIPETATINRFHGCNCAKL